MIRVYGEAGNLIDTHEARGPLQRAVSGMRGTIGEIVAAPGGIDLSAKVLDESVAVASACGHKLSEAPISQLSAILGIAAGFVARIESII